MSAERASSSRATVRCVAAPETAWTAAGWTLVAAFAALVLLDFRSHGITYDEWYHVRHGANVAAWYESGFEDRAFLSHMNLRNYGAGFDLPAHYAHTVTGMDPYEVKHLLTGLVAALALLGVGSVARRLAGARAGFFAILLALTMPRFFGHAFVNPKDVPFAAAYVWAVDAIVCLLRGLPAISVRRIVYVGVTCGSAMAVRMGGVLLLGYVGLTLGAWWLLTRCATTLAGAPPRRLSFRRLCVTMLGVGVIAFVVTLPFYPYFQLNPILNPLRVLKSMSHGSIGTFEVLFDGALVRNDRLPAGYVWYWALRALPDVLLAALGLTAVGLVLAGRARRFRMPLGQALGWGAVLMAALLPMILATIGRPVVYDGLRHFLFCTLLFAVPCGVGVAFVLSMRSKPWLRLAGGAVFLAALGLTVADMVRLHPYEAVYFNRLVAGGLSGVDGRLDDDYWGFTFREGAEWLNANRTVPGTRPRVTSTCFPESTKHFLDPEHFEYAGSVHVDLATSAYDDPPDYHIATSRWGGRDVYPGTIIHRVERDGVTLLVVIEVDRQAALARAR